MKTILKILPFLLSIISLSSCKNFGLDAISGSTLVWQSGSNNFFNQEPSVTLEGSKYITIDGEVESKTTIKLSKLPLRSITVKEARLSENRFKGSIINDKSFVKQIPTKENPAPLAPNGAPSINDGEIDFYGTFRYDGYALCDILSDIKVDKKSKEDFWPPVDLYIEVRNDAGDVAAFSWGELFYSANMYSIIIAKRATRVLTGKTGELWAYPSQTQIVVSSDLFSERNIPNPTSITIRSLKGNYTVNRDKSVYEKQPSFFTIASEGDTLAKINDIREELPVVSYPIIYYGHGMGYKGENTFTGQMLRDYITPYISKKNSHLLREGMLSISAIDGYRASFSLSEIINRNDQREVLLMHGQGKEIEEGRGGWSVYGGCDGFADRSIKGLTEIRLILPEN